MRAIWRNRRCSPGARCLCTSAAAMLNALLEADGERALRARLNAYARVQLLVIDEIVTLSYSNRHADLLFEVVSRRYERSSTLVTTNRPFAEWGEVFPNAACVVSLIDRLVHHAEIVHIDGESYRLKEAKEDAARRRQQRAACTTPAAQSFSPPPGEEHVSTPDDSL
ncbi:MAG: ATP-binding protein [Lamprobacter sp.]|uniref:ATP-binding protein n=1 Tax=Lamprobacter sp. TaxID=3100796 RepID=UPI002B25C8F5|nr:ATP-binding protein [Lamprobacter sp.]MEA3643134.1 ATP-binding protein [Lamprobacter sp.]